MLSLKFRYAVLGAVNAQEVMRVNVCFSIMVNFFLTVFENDSYSRHVENSFGYVYAPQTYTLKRLPWKVSVTDM
jgi:hypothetical protein